MLVQHPTRGVNEMSLSINDFKVYVPAKDFEQSKRFYSALGFAMSEGWGGTADFALNGNRFRLQDYYVKDWANNFMVVMGVDDVEAWHEHVRKIADSGEFDNIRITAPESVGDSVVLHVVDPSGVLLVFVQ
jgi:predicted enzyme related to lactoylglutathione lyase